MSIESYIHRFVPATEPNLPTILALHGTGGNENDLIGLVQTVAPGCAILSPRGNVLERGMPRFFRRFAEGVFDLADVAQRSHELAAFVASAATHYGFAPHNVYALGYSNGANIAVASLLLSPRTFKGAMLWRSQLTLVPEEVQSLAGKPVLMSAGRYDPLITVEQSEALYEQLRSRGAAVSLAWQESQHGLVQSDIEMTAGWFRALIS